MIEFIVMEFKMEIMILVVLFLVSIISLLIISWFYPQLLDNNYQYAKRFKQYCKQEKLHISSDVKSIIKEKLHFEVLKEREYREIEIILGFSFYNKFNDLFLDFHQLYPHTFRLKDFLLYLRNHIQPSTFDSLIQQRKQFLISNQLKTLA